MTIYVEVKAAQRHLSALIAATRRGEEVVLTLHGAPQVRLEAVEVLAVVDPAVPPNSQ